MKQQKIKGYIAVSERDKSLYMKEQFKGEVVDNLAKFPKELGVEHPFSFEDTEKVMKKVGLINGVLNKLTDNIIGEFSVRVDNPNSQKIIEGLVEDPSFRPAIREWIFEGLGKGNGFMDLTNLKENKLKTLNANNMYVDRDVKGKVKGFNQYLGNLTRFTPNSRKLIPFKPNEIAHLKINTISGEAYGLGIVWPSERSVENLVQEEQDKTKLVKRKAGAPIHAKMGQPGESVATEDIDAMSEKLKYMTNRTEWVSDGNVEFKVIEFGDIGKNLTESLRYTFLQLLAGMQVPEVMMGSGQLNEGIAKVQLEGIQRTIAAYQHIIEGIIEEQILRPLLNENGLDEKIEFSWNLPSESEINTRLEKLTALLGNMAISENMKRMIQLEIAKLLDFEDADEYLLSPEVGIDDDMFDMNVQGKEAEIDGTKTKVELNKVSTEAKKEAMLKQPEVPGAKPNAREIGEINLKEQAEIIATGDISIKEFVQLQEIKGFNYSDYLINILRQLRIDKFEDLAAFNEAQIEQGLLPEEDIKKLRVILRDGFRRNKSIRQIETDIKNSIQFKDRLDESGKLTLSAESRPNIVTRTETVRIANVGLLNTFKENNVKQVRYLAALSDRTCPICEGKNGEIHQLNESYGVIPVHPNCRCTWISI